MAFPAFKDWKAPWEESGDEFDAEKAKKRIYDLSKDKASQSERIASLRSEMTELKDEVDDLTDERDKLAKGKTTEAQGAEEDKVAKAVADALAAAGIKPKSTKEKRRESEKDDDGFDIEKARLEIALEKGLTKAQVARLQGKNLEELTADADAYMEEQGLTAGESEGGNGGTEGQAPPSQRAKVKTGTRQGPREVDPYEGLDGDALYDKVYGTA